MSSETNHNPPSGDPAPQGSLVPGQHVGSYRVVRELGEGGMATVYEAIHEHIEQRAAIKVLKPEFSRNAEMATRFLNEARAVNIVRHPGLVSISEFGRLPDGSAFIVMEYLEGESLAGRLRRLGALPLPVVLRLGRQMASALQAAHDKGIIHRDLKPANVMIVADPDMAGGERTKILDFGIAKVALQSPPGVGPGIEQHATVAGALMGTPAYMSPEQCRGAGGVTDKADVYSLGLMLYEMLAGRLPFITQVPYELLAMQLYQQPPPLRELCSGVPEEAAALVHSMLAKDPQERPRMAKVAAELERMGSSVSSALNVVGMKAGTGTVALQQGPNTGAGGPPSLQGEAQKQAGTGGRRRRTLFMALGTGLGLAAVLGVWAMTARPKGEVPQVPPPPLRHIAVTPDLGVPEHPDLLVPRDLSAEAPPREAVPEEESGHRTRHPSHHEPETKARHEEAPPAPVDEQPHKKNGRPTYRGTKAPIDTDFPGSR